ncbi:polysaccharide deacetylase family protein [Thermoflavimicrobium daqui]|uniref:polysaccharide deacetylase family protein n=1 Tax=Thermoflavimicrobium daqui TaxID=2137476 RepID=UPI0023E7EF55|nr:polysaccharide deacetylase family protein [Thermoflavimicrobium daqui]
MSLDFELYWGVRDQFTKEAYTDNLLGVQQAIPAILKLFEQYRIHATWAIVGFLYFQNKQELLAYLPSIKPNYIDRTLCPYKYLDSLPHCSQVDPFHFSPSLIQLISTYPFQEIGTHTFSHYYCLAKGQSSRAFQEDLKQAIAVGKKFGYVPHSIVFPRNQVNEKYLQICKKMGITSYRGTEKSWFYQTSEKSHKQWIKRFLRLIDAYLPLSGHNCYQIDQIKRDIPFNIAASRFLRPFSKSLRVFEIFRLKRILSDLTYAAKKGAIYHLWWHPHNFGVNLRENIIFLQKILEHFLKLQHRYGMKSMNMDELSQKLSAI